MAKIRECKQIQKSRGILRHIHDFRLRARNEPAVYTEGVGIDVDAISSCGDFVIGSHKAVHGRRATKVGTTCRGGSRYSYTARSNNIPSRDSYTNIS